MPVNTDINWGEQIGSNVVGDFTNWLIKMDYGLSDAQWDADIVCQNIPQKSVL